MQEAISFTPQLAASPIAGMLWLIPAVPIVASGVIALLKQPRRKVSATLAIGSLSFSLLLSLVAFGHVLGWMVAWPSGARDCQLYLDSGGTAQWTWAGCSIRCRR